MPSKETSKEVPKRESTERVPSYGLLCITHAYNEGRISLNDWLKQSREWAEAVIQQYDKKKLA